MTKKWTRSQKKQAGIAFQTPRKGKKKSANPDKGPWVIKRGEYLWFTFVGGILKLINRHFNKRMQEKSIEHE